MIFLEFSNAFTHYHSIDFAIVGVLRAMRVYSTLWRKTISIDETIGWRAFVDDDRGSGNNK